MVFELMAMTMMMQPFITAALVLAMTTTTIRIVMVMIMMLTTMEIRGRMIFRMIGI